MWASGMPQGLPIVKLLVEEFKIDPNVAAVNGNQSQARVGKRNFISFKSLFVCVEIF